MINGDLSKKINTRSNKHNLNNSSNDLREDGFKLH